MALADWACPSWWQVFLCWLSHWWRRIGRFYLRWKRLFPPDLWGPYGPWSRVVRVLERTIGRAVDLLRGRVGRR